MIRYALLRALLLLLLLPSATQALPAPDAINDIAFVAQTQIAINVTANDTPAGNVQIQSGSLTGVPVTDGRVRISSGLALFDPKVPNQLLSRENPFESFSYTVQNDAGSDTATVRVYYFTGLRGTYFRTVGNLAGSGRSFDLRMTLTSTGAVTGKLLWDGEEYPLNYTVSSTGRLLIQEPKKNGDGLLIADLTLEPAPPNLHNFTGTFQDTSTAAPLTANVDLIFVDTNSAMPSQMLVTFIDPQDVIGAPFAGRNRGDGGVLLPEGVGFARVKPGKNGIARFQTTMPDYARFKKSYPLVPENQQTGRPSRYDVLAEPYGRNRGKVAGEAEVGSDTVLAVDTMAADLEWERLPSAAARRSSGQTNASPIFPGGFAIAAYLQGFTFDSSPGPRKTPQGFDPSRTPNADVLLAGGSLDEPIRFPAKIDQAKGVAISTNDPRVAALDFNLKLKFSQGFISGSFKHPVNGKKVRFTR